jgi:hypothetical protein
MVNTSPRATLVGLNFTVGAAQLAMAGWSERRGTAHNAAAVTANAAPKSLTQRFFTAIRQASS